MKTLAFLLACFSIVSAAEFGTRSQSKSVSLLTLQAKPLDYDQKMVSFWGVLGGYRDGSYVFFTSDHARWRDIDNGFRIETDHNMIKIGVGDKEWIDLYGKAVRIDAKVHVRLTMGGSVGQVLLVAKYIFVPDDERQFREPVTVAK